jgi:hypothetical protein
LLSFDVVFQALIALAVDADLAEAEHHPRTRDALTHSGTFHTILDQMPASTLGNAAVDGTARRQAAVALPSLQTLSDS